jgi:hypothetical protein
MAKQSLIKLPEAIAALALLKGYAINQFTKDAK